MNSRNSNKIPFNLEKYQSGNYEVVCRNPDYKVLEIKILEFSGLHQKIGCTIECINENIVFIFHANGIKQNKNYCQKNDEDLFLISKEIPFNKERALRGDAVKMRNGSILTDLKYLSNEAIIDIKSVVRLVDLRWVGSCNGKIYFFEENGEYAYKGNGEYDLVMVE
jgi:hypothetical protein